MSAFFAELVARKKYNLPKDFQFHTWDASDDFYMKVTGKVVTEQFTKGKRKGSWNWKLGHSQRECIVSRDEIANAKAEYEASGLCCNCIGEGKTLNSVNFVTGEITYRECSRCKGTGKSQT